MKFAITKDFVRIIAGGQTLVCEEEVPIEKFLKEKEYYNLSLYGKYDHVKEKVMQSQKNADFGYTDFCIDCAKLDYIVQGYCKPCFDVRGLKYERSVGEMEEIWNKNE